MSDAAAIVLNTGAGGGSAARRWTAVESEVRRRIGRYELLTGAPDVVACELGRLARSGTRDFVAAGGDGTVNLVIDALARIDDPGLLAGVRVGAVGLGSSNDFHKPYRTESTVRGVPLRLDRDGAELHDVGRLRYADARSVERLRHWIINASIGTTAEANSFFNSSSRVIRALKRASPWRGIVWATVRTLVRYRSRPMTITVDAAPPLTVRLKNLAVVKNPHFSGSLWYDTPHEPGSGLFYVHLLEHVPPLTLVRTLGGLTRGRFSGRPGTRSWHARAAAVTAEEPFPIELDGEIVVARRAEFDLLPRLLQVCR